ncbi:MAG: deoxyribodipyrimidine photolyase [Nitrospinae bacterium]|nr:deoxyribodipyrimidine photolyase [Nitrospinota bacterium]
MIEKTRIKLLNEKTIQNRESVIYWMQSSQRSSFNHALEYAIQISNKLNKFLKVYFVINKSYPEAQNRHFIFMLQGLYEVQKELTQKKIQMILEIGNPIEIISKLSRKSCLIVTDRAYTKTINSWKKEVSNTIDCQLVQVETEAIVPIEEVSNKEEYGAYTIRPKIKKLLGDYLHPLNTSDIKNKYTSRNLFKNIEKTKQIIENLNPVSTPTKEIFYKGGSVAAKQELKKFLEIKAKNYIIDKNNPSLDIVSNMSPYLHFGQISPLEIALEVLNHEMPQDSKESYLEELIIRRELSFNFVFFNASHDNFDCLPKWCKDTLINHKKDKRSYIYSLEELELAKTHDPYWNAAQKEMVIKGKMHGYMRMYWGKKIIEWTKNPETAFSNALYLNNKYQLDGRDPNSYTGVAWCFGKHDRAWKERNIFGKIRYMNANGLRRKFNIEAYVNQVRTLCTNL